MATTVERPTGRTANGTAMTVIGVVTPFVYAIAACAFLVWAAVFSEEGGEPASPVGLAYAVFVLTLGGLAVVGLGACAIVTAQRWNSGRPAGPIVAGAAVVSSALLFSAVFLVVG